MKIETKAVHAGDRKRIPGQATPVTTPIVNATSFVHESTETLDHVMGNEEPGWSQSWNPRFWAHIQSSLK